jgi:hypothetical protein
MPRVSSVVLDPPTPHCLPGTWTFWLREELDLSGHGSVGSHVADASVEPGHRADALDDLSAEERTHVPNDAPLRTQDLQGKSIRASAGRLSQVLRGPRKDLMRDQRG